jgi:hypothetical protein
MASGVLVDAEVFVNATYGYDIRGEIVGERGTVALAEAAGEVIVKSDGGRRSRVPVDWRDRFAGAFDAELQDWLDVVEFVQQTQPAGSGANVTTLLDAVPARYPTSFVLITTPNSSHLIWQMNEHVPHLRGSNGHLTDDEKVRLAGVFIISDPDREITKHFERWFYELANSVERTPATSEQLKKSERSFPTNDMLVRELFAAIDAQEWKSCRNSSALRSRTQGPVSRSSAG